MMLRGPHPNQITPPRLRIDEPTCTVLTTPAGQLVSSSTRRPAFLRRLTETFLPMRWSAGRRDQHRCFPRQRTAGKRRPTRLLRIRGAYAQSGEQRVA